MNMKIRTAAGGGLASKKLLAAIAVLAVAFAVFAAIPAVADDSDAAGAEKIVYVSNGGNDTTGDGSESKPYATIQKALTVADVTQVSLLSDMKLTGEGRVLTISKSITFDMGNHVLTVESNAVDTGKTDSEGNKIGNAGGINIEPAGSNVVATMQNGTVKFTVNYGEGNWVKNHCAMIVSPSGSYTATVQFNKLNFESSEYAIYAMGSTAQRNVTWSEPSINVIINGGSIKSTSAVAAISTNGNYGGEYVEIRNAKLISEKGPAVYAPSNGKWVVEDSELTGVSGIDQRSGSIEVKGDTTITYNGPDAGITKEQYDGPVAFGVGVSVMPNYGYSHAGTSIVIEDSVKFVKGTSAGDQIFVSPMEYSEVTYDKMKNVTTGGAIGADTFVQYKGVALKYSMSESEKDTANFPSFMTFSDSKIDLTVGAGSTAAISQNVTGKLTNNGVVQVAAGKTLDVSTTSAYTSGVNSKVYLASGATLKVPTTTTSVSNVYAGADAKVLAGNNELTTLNVSTVTDAAGFIEAVNGGVEKITVSNDFTLTDDIVIPEKTTVTIAEGKTLTLANGKTLTVNGAITGTIKGTAATGGTDGVAKLEDFSGDFQVKAGSLEITGASIENGKITVISGEIVLEGQINGDIEFVVQTSSSATVIFRNAVVGPNATITLVKSDNITYQVEGAMNLYGSIVSAEEVELDVPDEDKDSFKAYSGAKISKVKVTGSGKIDLSLAQGPQTVGEDISSDKTYGQLENVTIVGSLTIKNNAKVTVLGGFNVNEGVVLTIEKGSVLEIKSAAASMVVEGKIVVEEGAQLIVTEAKDVKVSGAIESEGIVSIDSKVTVKSGGSIVISDGTVSKPKTAVSNNAADVVKLYSSVFEPKQGLVIEAGATLTVKSLIYTDGSEAMVIENKGTVIFDKAVIGAPIDVKMLADGAVVQIVSVENIATSVGTDGKATAWAIEALSITDAGLKFPDKSSIDTNNLIIINSQGYAFKGLTVVEKITSEVDDNGDTVYENHMDLAGSVSAAKVEEVSNAADSTYNLVFSIVGPYQDVSGELTLGKNVVLNVTRDAKLSVSGKLIATEDGSKIENQGEITVTGLVQVAGSANKIADVINAAVYETRSGTDTIYNYTTLKAAVDAAAKDITVRGTVKVDESFTVPKDTTVKNEGTIVVGSDDDTEVTLTFADGAVLKAGTVDVKGTLYFENKKDNKASKIESDVSVIGEKDARFTNLFTALNNAKAGDTVTVDRNVDLKKSITIKEGVTLDVPVSKTLTVFAGVTITVNGTLKTATKVLLDENVAFAGEANKRENKAAIVANGVFMSMDEQTYAYYQIAGAYYHLTDSVGDYNYITTLENASKSAATKVYVYGKVTAGDVAFTGTSTTAKNVYIMEGADLTVASITLDKAKLMVLNDGNSRGKFTGDVKVGDSAVTAKNVTTFFVEVDKDGLMIVEAVAAVDDKSAFTVSAGKVSVFTSALKTTVAAGAELTSYKDQTSNIYGELVIDGTVTVANEQEISAYSVTVKGTLSIADATDSKGAGKFTVNGYLYIGLTKNDIEKTTGDAASVNGAVTGVSVAFIKADATVSEATIDSFKNDAGVLKSTTYIVEDKDWMTVYDRTGAYNIATADKAPVENAIFQHWLNTDGKQVGSTDKIGASKCDKVTASIEYEIYTILINADAGVESIAIDGNLMIKESETGMYGMTVKAGTHEITCKLANGYSGEAKFAIVDSQTTDGLEASVSGNKVTVTGEEGHVLVQITGITASGYVQPTEPAQDDKDDGLSLTDILLIILVVLIVVMAIIVALRLMRS